MSTDYAEGGLGIDAADTFPKSNLVAERISRSCSPDFTLDVMRTVTELGAIQDSEPLHPEEQNSGLNEDRRSIMILLGVSQLLEQSDARSFLHTNDDGEDDFFEIDHTNFSSTKSRVPDYGFEPTTAGIRLTFAQVPNFDIRKYRAWVGNHLLPTE